MNKLKTPLLLSCIAIFLFSCQNQAENKVEITYEKGTFGYNLEKLQAIEGLEVLENGDAIIAVSGPFQARILTSSAKGKAGKSYGWVNLEMIEKGEQDSTMAYMGGESRMWFAPEWGPNSLFFPKGAVQVDSTMRAPHDLNNKKFTEIHRTASSLTFGGQLQLQNNNNYVFNLDIERTITLLSKEEIEKNLGITLSSKLAHVGFSATTSAKNIGKEQFTQANGLVSIWELGCMLTSPDTRVILPLSEATDSITEYFTPIADRVIIQDEVVYYKADATGINKIGIPPQYAKNVMGSYSPANQLLNIATFSLTKDGVFVNSVPKNTTPYQGDVINIFNGNPEIPFYEFESSSSAKELKPQEKMQHQQTTYHFEGSEAALDEIAQTVLGVSLKEIPEF
ncbi:MAG: DUF6786 family protein [Bacteroidota bacterium]